MAALTLEDARRVSAAAEAKAAEFGVGATITVVDGGGHVRDPRAGWMRRPSER